MANDKQRKAEPAKNTAPMGEKPSIETFDFDYDLPTDNFEEIALSRTWYKPRFACTAKRPNDFVPLTGDLIGVDSMMSPKYADSKSGGQFFGMTIRATKHSIGVDAKDNPVLIEPGDLVLMVAVGPLKNILPLATHPTEVCEVVIAPQQKVELASGNNWWEMKFGVVKQPDGSKSKPRGESSAINLAKIFKELPQASGVPAPTASSEVAAAS